jgi:hypothetical protein
VMYIVLKTWIISWTCLLVGTVVKKLHQDVSNARQSGTVAKNVKFLDGKADIRNFVLK